MGREYIRTGGRVGRGLTNTVFRTKPGRPVNYFIHLTFIGGEARFRTGRHNKR